MAVQTLTDKRFRRVHVKPSRRRRAVAARRRVVLGMLGFGALGVALFSLPSLLRTAPFLQIQTITVQGHQQVSRGEVLALIGDLQGQNILVADLDEQRERMLTLGWVKDATFRRVLPATVEVSVQEREPVGLARFGARLYLVDALGVIIDEHGPRFGYRDLPIIDGLSTGDRAHAVDPDRARLATSVITALESDRQLGSLVSQIDVTDPYDAVVLLHDAPTLVHLGNERFVERLGDYLALAPALRSYVTDIDYVDLRFEQRVFIRPREPRADEVTQIAAGRAPEAGTQ